VRRAVALAAAAAALLACSAPPVPPTTRYLLRVPEREGSGPVETADVGLGAVRVAPYLRETGLMVETGPHQVRPARFHRWAEPLSEGVRRLLRSELSRALGREVAAVPAGGADPATLLEVQIDRLHASLGGRALLVARWRVVRDGRATAFRHVRSAPLPRDGYAGVVEAEIGLLRELGAAMADSLPTSAR